MRRSLFLIAAVLASTVGLGCDPDAAPAMPSCFTDPVLCEAPDGGQTLSFPPTARRAGGPQLIPTRPIQPVPDGGPPSPGQCTGAQIPCEGVCVDPLNDVLNCGGCGFECPLGEECRFGQCCGVGELLCDGLCVDVLVDGSNCGVCGFSCGIGVECVNGICSQRTPPGF